MYKYNVIESVVYDEEKQPRKVYGIQATDENGEIIESYPDVFFKKDKALELASACNDGELSILHFADVIEDALID